MAGDWVKMRSNLDTHPKVVAMATTLNTSELHVVGMLWKVWTWADQHSLDGNAISVTESFLNRITGVTGFAHAMREVGWLDGNDGELSFPRFSEHNGKTAKARSETAVRVNKHRETAKRKRNTDSVTGALPEKRREEKSLLNPHTPSKKPKTAKPDGNGWDLKEQDLADTNRIIGWMRHTKLIPETHANELRVLAAAERAISVEQLSGGPPVNRQAYFVSIVRDENWKVITDADMDRAKLRHSAWIRGQPRAELPVDLGSIFQTAE